MKIIITEDQFNLIKENKFILDIKEFGFKEISELVGGNKNLLKLLEINTPEEFLSLYNDLDVVQSEEKEGVTLYRYKKGYNLMRYDKKTRNIDINYNDIWSVLINTFELNYGDIQALIKAWLETTYNLRGSIPYHMRIEKTESWRLHTI